MTVGHNVWKQEFDVWNTKAYLKKKLFWQLSFDGVSFIEFDKGTITYYFLRPFIYGAFVFRKFLCPSFKANVRRFLHPKKHNFISFPTVSITFLLSGSIQQQFSFFWYHPIWEISRIHEKCANCVLLHSKSLQNFLSNSSFTPFLWSGFHKCIISKWSEELPSIRNKKRKISHEWILYLNQ